MNAPSMTAEQRRRRNAAKLNNDAANTKVIVKRGTRIVGPYSESSMRYFGENNFIVMTVEEAKKAGYLSGNTRRDIRQVSPAPVQESVAVPVEPVKEPEEEIVLPAISADQIEKEAELDFIESDSSDEFDEQDIDKQIEEIQRAMEQETDTDEIDSKFS